MKVQEHAEVPAGLVLKVGEVQIASFAKAEGQVALEEGKQAAREK